MSSSSAPLLRRLVLATAALTLLGCHPGADARARLYSTDAEDRVQQVLGTPARLTVVYWPALGRCMPTEMVLLDEFAAIQDSYPDIRFVTVLPETAGEGEVLRYERPLPGALVRLEPELYAAQNRLGPRPRVEVWSARKELLLLQSIPPFAPRARAVAEEIIWTRSFTTPLAEVIR